MPVDAERERIQGDGVKETLAIPARVRFDVDERDQGTCRVCGQHAGERRALHHVRYGGDYTGMGGRRLHSVDNIVTVGWLFEHDCHSIVHSNKGLWLPLLVKVLEHPGTTALQHYRWAKVNGGSGRA